MSNARRAKSGRSVPSGNALPRQHPAQPVSAGSRDELPRRGHGRRNRTPLPPLELVAPSLINSTPAASRAAITLVRLSITPRTVPLLASMRWIVGSDTPDATARAFWSMPTRTRAAFICAAVSNILLQHTVTNFLRTHSLTTQTSYLISTSCFQHQNCHLEPVRPYVDVTQSAPLKSAQQPQHSVQDRVRMGGTAGDVEIDRKQIVNPIAYFRVAPEQTTGYRAGAGGDNQLGLGDGFVGLERRLPHVCGERTGDEDAVGMPRRGDEFDPEAARVEDDVAEGVDLNFAPVAASGADLAQPQRPPEQPP